MDISEKQLIASCTLMVAGILLIQGPVAAAPAPVAHNNAPCGSCHEGGAAAVSHLAVKAACVACHRSAHQSGETGWSGETRPIDYLRRNDNCIQCHSFHDAAKVLTRAGAIDLRELADVDPGHCRACHGPRGDIATLSPAHLAAARLYHEDLASLRNLSLSDACLTCHSNNSSSPWQGTAPGRILAFNEHASHPFGMRVTPGSGDSSNWIAHEIDPRLPLFRGRMECQTCHLLTADNDDLMVPFPAKYDLCKGCHRHYGDDDVLPAVVARLDRP